MRQHLASDIEHMLWQCHGRHAQVPQCARALHPPSSDTQHLQAVAFGMGGGLLQKVNRDTMSFATKLSHIVYADGSRRDIMKAPSSDTSKASLPGEACN